jgi:hypothetical protein
LELNRVVPGRIEELTVAVVAVIIVLRFHDVKVWDPAKFTEHVSSFANFCIIRHSRAFNFVFFVGVKLTTWYKRDGLIIAEGLIEIFL